MFSFVSVSVVNGEILHIVKISRLHMGAYLCVASNEVPPSVSARVDVRVQCKLFQADQFFNLNNYFLKMIFKP